MSTPSHDSASSLEQVIDEFLRAEEALRAFEESISQLESARVVADNAGAELVNARSAVYDAADDLRRASESFRTTSEQLRENAITIGRFRPDAIEESLHELSSRAEELSARVAAMEGAVGRSETSLSQLSGTVGGLANHVAGVVERSSDLRLGLDALTEAVRAGRTSIDQLERAATRAMLASRKTMLAALLAALLSGAALTAVLVLGA